MKRPILFLTSYVIVFVLFLFLSKQFEYHYEVGAGYLDMLFSIEQATLSFCILLFFFILGKNVNYLTGTAIWLGAILIISTWWMIDSSANVDFFTDYFLKPLGLSLIEIPQVAALLLSILLLEKQKVPTL